MNKMIYLIVLFLFLCPTISSAHPPSNVNIVVDGTKVIIGGLHNVSDPTTHYVELLVLKKNKREIVRQTFSVQEGNQYQAVYNVPSLKKGDNLDVEVFCSRGGSKHKDIIVE